MKAILRLQQFADLDTATPENKAKMGFVRGKTREGKPTAVAVYPAGTEFEGQMALQLVATGQAIPSDDECRKACGKTQDELNKLAQEYEMNVKGINDPAHRELYKAGVITGYDKDGKFMPGPMWEAYHEAMKDGDDNGEDE
jgi:hypothetical protein